MNKELTKEECLKALRYLTDYNGEEFNVEIFANAIEDLHLLIYKHFDNPPLKFEELEELEGKSLWDNKMGKWVLLQQAYVWKNTSKQVLIVYLELDLEEGLETMNYWEDFEENRFYRHEVKEAKE